VDAGGVTVTRPIVPINNDRRLEMRKLRTMGDAAAIASARRVDRVVLADDLERPQNPEIEALARTVAVR